MEKQDFINDFIKDHEVVGWDEEGNEAGKGIWIDKEDYNEITELIKQVCGCECSDESAALPLHGVSGSLPLNKDDAVKMLTAFLRDTVEMINGKRFAPSLKPEYWFDEYVKRGQ